MSAARSSIPAPVVATRRVARWLDTLGVSPMALDDTLAWFNPMWRVHQLQARVVRRVAETPSAVTLVLQTGPAFPALRPGQFVVIGVTIDGVCHRRAYSPRTLPDEPGHIAITVQRQPDGLVSTYVQDSLPVGSMVAIEAPSGEFVLPAALPAEVLLIAGGSGITPCMAMLQHLHAHAAHTRVTLLYFARSPVDRIFGQELARLARQWRQLHYVPVDSVANTAGVQLGQASGARTLDLPMLDAACPNWRQTVAYCCGPAPLMDAARALWHTEAPHGTLHLEAFTAPRASGDPDARHAVTLRRSGDTARFDAAGNMTLLVAGETAGLSIKHGCRQGICHECTCRLTRGTVQDLSTGQRVEGEGQPVRLCVTSAMSDIELDALNG
ncbi:2Fe-2S iron-sulfur cluster binding domain-containing protein [Aquabacterium fontiphilum]|uniref:ferredoxin reductase n=1 Tax=Aquabacterium fontiphilum TaxID=450365 RepID=UPI001378C267|nr:ferredoxin reductase [Aquabacterium fontiphilum]NBD20393.1 2Fe-2S iron-sulfur cluster binding domain-containing protein [Aquabacterium fontiphilum]